MVFYLIEFGFPFLNRQ